MDLSGVTHDDGNILRAIKARAWLRLGNEFESADNIRNMLMECGMHIEDGKDFSVYECKDVRYKVKWNKK